MNYMKYFNESDSWAGSLYAYNNPEVKNKPITYSMPIKKSNEYICSDCGIEFIFIEEDGDPFCPVCSSTNLEIKN